MIIVKQTPLRIVSLVPSQTELLYDLGLEDNIVGITKFCVHPIHFKNTKKSVGGTKQIKIEKIKALKPDIILCNKEENTKEIVEACSEICKVHVSELYTLEDTIALVKEYGVLFNKRTEALKISVKIEYNLNEFKEFIKDKPVLKVAYFIWREPWMVAANNTFINHLLELNNFKNIYANLERYPEVEINKLQQQGDPDLVLLSSEPYPFKDEHAFELGRFSHHSKTVFVDGEYFSWYGSRLIGAFDYFRTLRNRL
ncbi:ABC transporter substrate-binding protein [Bizionia gelidisalsuginis]|uniref:ABC transporter substrate-binding protein n=1 Tax=Bizionia gelidisalsuginis TaxID=291188 RepID=A0ABY3MDT8_9FLAO|nr:helical backbone metal receptor [Bizionia gelidisalsuginis]TYC17158.1 ABC transporter substrate-binding protein [Bizionia gelidisalsuginis]